MPNALMYGVKLTLRLMYKPFQVRDSAYVSCYSVDTAGDVDLGKS